MALVGLTFQENSRSAPIFKVEQDCHVYLIDVQTSGGEAPSTNGWHMVDGDEDTLWVGRQGARGWWVTLSYSGDLPVSSVDVVCGGSPPRNFRVLGSTDGDDWFDMQKALSVTNPVTAGYLWFVFPLDELRTAPAIREIYVE